MESTISWHPGILIKNLAAGAFALALAIPAMAGTINLDATTDTGGNGWVAIAAPGAVTNTCYPCYTPIDNRYVGQNPYGDLPDGDLPPQYQFSVVPPEFPGIATFETDNPTWNSDPDFDTLGWQTYTGNWIDNLGTSPFFARDVVDIPGTPTAGSFTMLVDDDSEVWVNGILVPGLVDDDLNTGSPQTADISSYLQSGENVIAFLADNSHGGGYNVYDAYGSITYMSAATPEPQSFVLAGLGILAVLLMVRRRVLA